jgi:phosphoribosyl 1,2-cyclic phosphodiesterase
MPNSFPTDPDVITVYLGSYTHEHADRIAGGLEEAGIVWWYKQPGWLSQLWEFGAVRLFADRARLDEARAIAQAVVGDPDVT